MLVLGGDVGTLDHIANSLVNGIPVVLCQGSGGMADIVIEVLRMTRGRPFLEPEVLNLIEPQVKNSKGSNQTTIISLNAKGKSRNYFLWMLRLEKT